MLGMRAGAAARVLVPGRLALCRRPPDHPSGRARRASGRRRCRSADRALRHLGDGAGRARRARQGRRRALRGAQGAGFPDRPGQPLGSGRQPHPHRLRRGRGRGRPGSCEGARTGHPAARWQVGVRARRGRRGWRRSRARRPAAGSPGTPRRRRPAPARARRASSVFGSWSSHIARMSASSSAATGRAASSEGAP